MSESIAQSNYYDAVVIGAGAAGLLCAFTAAKRGQRVLLLEGNKKPGAKILISGGGRCNFTNEDATAANYISENPHFAKSALSRYTPWDIMGLLGSHGLTWHEKTLGQLFCDQGSKAVLQALLDEGAKYGVELRTSCPVQTVERDGALFKLVACDEKIAAKALVVASGGMSIPKMGATDLGYRIARQFGLRVVEPVPALVPLTFEHHIVEQMKQLAGVAADALVSCNGKDFRENLLFTHRGLSGPAILQISSYWQHGDAISINFLPHISDALAWLKEQRTVKPKASLKKILNDHLPERLADYIAAAWPGNLAGLSNKQLQAICNQLVTWDLTPTGSEGFKKAEVTRGGVSTDYLSSKTMEVKEQPGLYFIGECVDVTGWLGGYNFQWAWASGHACGMAL